MDIDKIACWNKSGKINSNNQSITNNVNGASFNDVLQEQEEIAARNVVAKYGIPPRINPNDDDNIEKYAVPDIEEPVEEPEEPENKIKYYPPLLKYAVPKFYGENTSPVGKYSIPEPPKPMYAIPTDNK